MYQVLGYHLRRAGLVLQAHPPIPFLWSGRLLFTSFVSCSSRRGHWEGLELGGSFGMGILSQESLSPDLSLSFHVSLPWET